MRWTLLFLLIGATQLLFTNCGKHYELEAIQGEVTTSDQNLKLNKTSDDDLAQQSSFCLSHNFEQIIGCLNEASQKNISDIVTIHVITPRLELQLGQVIRLAHLQNVRLVGRANGTNNPVVITESKERLQSDALDDRYFIEVVGKSSQISVENFRFVDPMGTKALLQKECLTGAHPTNPNLWNPRICYAPILIGGSSRDISQVTSNVTLKNLDITSDKAILMEVLRTNSLTVENSIFKGGTVYGIFLHASYLHRNTRILSNSVSMAGTAGISIANAENTLIAKNKVFDNHIIPQYVYEDSKGQKKLYPGGQIYIASIANAPIDGVKIIENDVSMTPKFQKNEMTYGIEIMNGEAAPVRNVLVEKNNLHKISRGGISVHNSARLGQKNIQVFNNRLEDVSMSFPGNPASSYIQLEVSRSFPNRNHPNVDIGGNFLLKTGLAPLSGRFVNPSKTCRILASGSCTITLEYEILGNNPGAKPILKLDGINYRVLNSGTKGTIVIPGIRNRNYTFSLHTNANDENPLAVVNIGGI